MVNKGGYRRDVWPLLGESIVNLTATRISAQDEEGIAAMVSISPGSRMSGATWLRTGGMSGCLQLRDCGGCRLAPSPCCSLT